jgi:hydroxymethylglutaryl-CoA reductase
MLHGFSKLSKEEKLNVLANQFEQTDIILNLKRFWHTDESEQKLFDEFSENTLTNFYLPFGVAPNFIINEKLYHIPMVIEESSVVAAAANAAKFWAARGGFKAKVIDHLKVGQVHFTWKGDVAKLQQLIDTNRALFFSSVNEITEKMEKRGGGIKDIKLINKTTEIEDYYQLYVTFDTCDAMGANFINSVLESFAHTLTNLVQHHEHFTNEERQISIIMSILSNYTPNCLVKAWARCKLSELDGVCEGLSGEAYAKKLVTAVQIAKKDVNRAVTHNKGIFNGIDAVVLATGNDFRAVEACGHAYASRHGQYESLTSAQIKDDHFIFEIEIPLALGTVGGLTSLHPLSKVSLSMLGNPSAQELMMVTACVGLAQNFGALKSLTTTGIQKGHMKMHLMNILNQYEASEKEIKAAKEYFVDKVVSVALVKKFLDTNRGLKH